MSRPKPRVAILVVNGIGRRGRSAWVRRRDNTDQALKYPWIDLCLRQLERHSLGWDYQVSVFDNSHLALHRKLMRDHRHVRVEPGAWFSVGGHIVTLILIRHAYRLFELSHPRALDYLARRVSADFEYIVTLDTDSFPIRDDWLDILVSACERGAAVAAYIGMRWLRRWRRSFMSVGYVCVGTIFEPSAYPLAGSCSQEQDITKMSGRRSRINFYG